ncbi:helix-turn-helix domain-containing protein [Paenibacillus sp. CMAA1364]
MKEHLALFKDTHCFNKAQVQLAFKNYMEINVLDPEEHYPEPYRSKLIDLCERFQNALDNCSLPQLTDDWWFYDYERINDGIDLRLYFCEEFDIDENGMESMIFTEGFTLLSVKCDYVNVEQFATINNVTEITVRQWIRRGKLRTAKKVGRDWLIPSIAVKPVRGFSPASYYWDQLPMVLSDSFPFLIGYKCIYIFQNEQVKQQFDCILGYPGQNDRMKTTLTTTEREKLELALISSSVIRVEEY